MSLYFDWMREFRTVNRNGKNFTTAEMAVLFSAATRADHSGQRIFRGIRGLVDDTGASHRTVIRALDKARDCNVFKRVVSGKRGTNQADEYVLVHPSHWRLPHADTGADVPQPYRPAYEPWAPKPGETPPF